MLYSHTIRLEISINHVFPQLIGFASGHNDPTISLCGSRQILNRDWEILCGFQTWPLLKPIVRYIASISGSTSFGASVPSFFSPVAKKRPKTKGNWPSSEPSARKEGSEALAKVRMAIWFIFIWIFPFSQTHCARTVIVSNHEPLFVRFNSNLNKLTFTMFRALTSVSSRLVATSKFAPLVSYEVIVVIA